MKKISIAMCTYNGARFLRDQLESILRQKRLPDELIIIDDRSTDETVELIKEFIKMALFVVDLHINDQTLGSTKNFEKAVSRCSGDIIFLADQDDVWREDKIKIIAAEFERNADLGLVFTDAELVTENLAQLGIRLMDRTFPADQREKAGNGRMLEVLLSQNCVTGATTAFRSDLRDKFLPIPENIPNMIHDAWIALVAAAVGKVLFLDTPLVQYRQHPGQQLGLGVLDHPAAGRRMRYERSLNFVRNEIERLLSLSMLIDDYDVFSNSKDFIRDILPSLIEQKRQLEIHYTARKDLPDSRLKRIWPTVNELLSRRYHRFSKGFLSAVKDLVED